MKSKAGPRGISLEQNKWDRKFPEATEARTRKEHIFILWLGND